MPTIYLGTLAHLRANPFEVADALEILDSAALLVDDAGTILGYGRRDDLLGRAPEARKLDYGDAWLLPGLIDAHIHFPQYYATAAYGGQLLDWLVQSILPAETLFADPDFANGAAQRFIRHLLACGTTTAMVFGSQFFRANQALFAAAKDYGIRLIAGATLMDRTDQGVPECLLQSPGQAQADAEALIELCRDQPLLHYAVTPRYALSCSEAMLQMCAGLLIEHPEIYLQTHINENRQEIKSVVGYYSGCQDYLEVYERYGLVTGRTVLAHNIHATDAELARIAQAGCAVCHCPSSNLYLGSGLFPLARHVGKGIAVAVGTDIGAGTSFSIWRNLADAYKIQQLQGQSLDAAQLLYLATLGGARALRLGHETGNFAVGKSADFFVLDASGDHYLAERIRRCDSLQERLFCLLHLATEHQVRATFLRGNPFYSCS